MTLTLEEVIKNPVVTDALNTIANDKINGIAIDGCETIGNKVVELANEIIKLKESENYILASKALIKDLFSLLKKGDILNESFLKMFWRDFHLFTLNIEKRELWKPLVNDVDSQEFSFLFHSACMIIVSKIVALEKSKRPKHEFVQPAETFRKTGGGFKICCLLCNLLFVKTLQETFEVTC